MKVIRSNSTVMGVKNTLPPYFSSCDWSPAPTVFFSRSLFHVFLDHTLSLWVFGVHCSVTLVLTLNTGCFLSSWKSFVAYCTVRSPSSWYAQFVCWLFCIMLMPPAEQLTDLYFQMWLNDSVMWTSLSFKLWVKHSSTNYQTVLIHLHVKLFQSFWWYARQWTYVYVGMRWYTVRRCHLRTCFCSWETKLQWLPAVKSSLYVNNYSSVKFLALLAELLVYLVKSCLYVCLCVNQGVTNHNCYA